MANCKASLGMGHFLVNLKNEKDVYGSLFSLIQMDCDLTENEDYFQDDTIELGYESEADRRVQEALKEFGKPTTHEEFKVVANKVFESISNQEYFGVCELNIVKVGKNKLSLAYAYGGDYGV
jgi:hypothetical protein